MPGDDSSVTGRDVLRTLNSFGDRQNGGMPALIPHPEGMTSLAVAAQKLYSSQPRIAVLRQALSRETISRDELIQATGLKRDTILLSVRDLLATGFIEFASDARRGPIVRYRSNPELVDKALRELRAYLFQES